MSLSAVMNARVRGFRVVTLLAVTLLLVMAVGSYAMKTIAGAQDAGAAGLDDQIVQERKRIRMLNLEIASLGSQHRVGDLSRRLLNLGPLDPHRDIAVGALPAALAHAPPAPTKEASTPPISATDPATRQ